MQQASGRSLSSRSFLSLGSVGGAITEVTTAYEVGLRLTKNIRN